MGMNRRSFLKAVLWTGFIVKSNALAASLFVKEKLHKIKTIDISEESTEGGEITCFIDRGTLAKIQIEQCWESGKYSKQILLNQDGSILRVDEVITHYNAPFYVTRTYAEDLGLDSFFDEGKSQVTRNLYFFSGGRVSQYESSSAKPIDIPNIEQLCRERVEFVLEAINNPRPIGQLAATIWSNNSNNRGQTELTHIIHEKH